MILTVNVTQEMIDNGVQDNCEKCPVALALNTAMTEADYEYAHLEVIDPEFFYLWGREEHCIGLPGEASEFINDFDYDGRESVKPISFEVQLP